MFTSNNIHRFCLVLLSFTALLVAPSCSKQSKAAGHLKRADGYFAAQDYEKARIEYLNLLRLDPQNAQAIQRLGIIWSEQGALLQSLPFLLKAREIAPANLEVRRKLASALFSLRQIQEARKEALAILDSAPEDKEAILLLANSSVTDEHIAESKTRLEKLDPAKSAAYHIASAILAARKGEIETVPTSLQRAHEIAPDSVDVQLAFATYYQAKKETAKAREALKKAAELSGPRSAARLNYAGFLAQNGEREEARKVVAEVTSKVPDYLPAWTLQAELLFSEGKRDEALTTLERVFGQDPRNLQARSLQATILLAKGEAKKAAEIFKDLDAMFSSAIPTKVNLARAYLADRDVEKARAALTNALTINPDYPEAVLLLAQIYLQTGAARNASTALENLVTKNPDLLQAQLLLARAYQAQRRLDDAAAIFRGQIEKSPGQAAPLFLLAMVLRDQGKDDEARSNLEKAQDLAPADEAITFQLVELDIKKKDFASAHRRVQMHLDKKGDSWSALFLEGKVFAAEAKWKEAEEALIKALESKPNSTTVYNLLVDCYLAQGKAEAAIDRLKTYLDTDPKSLRHRMLLALLYDQQKGDREAAKAYELILTDKPDFVPALNNLAYLYSERLKEPGKALELAGKARGLAPDDPAVADTLGWVHYRKGEFQQALTFLDEAVGKAPDAPEIAFHAGMTRYMMGQRAQARAALEKAVAAKADYPGKEEARERLAALGGPAEQEDQTVAQLEALVQQQPGDPLLRERLGRAHEKQGESAKAAAAYEAALKINANLADALKGLARLYSGPLQDAGKARDFARKARTVVPNDPEVIGLLGRVALLEGDASAAYGLLQEAVRGKGGDAGLRKDLAWAAYNLGKLEEARGTMENINASAPNSAEAHEAAIFLALTLPAEGGWEALEPVAEQKLKEDPTFAPALMVRAALFESRGKPQDAIAAYETVLKRMPEFAPAQKRLAAVYAADAKQQDRAREMALKARKALPTDPDVARILGALIYQKGEAAYAVQLLEESAAKTPLDAEGLFFLGSAYLKSKETAKGEEILQKALDAGLNPPHADEAKAALTKSGKPD